MKIDICPKCGRKKHLKYRVVFLPWTNTEFHIGEFYWLVCSKRCAKSDTSALRPADFKVTLEKSEEE
jgi:hypothetical protein